MSSDHFATFSESQSRDWWSCDGHRSLKIHGHKRNKFELLFPVVVNCSRKDMVSLTVLFIPKLPYKEIAMGLGGKSYCTWTSFASQKL